MTDGLAAGRTQRAVAADAFGDGAVAREWTPDSSMRSQVRRWIRKARARADGGWRDHVPRGPEGT